MKYFWRKTFQLVQVTACTLVTVRSNRDKKNLHPCAPFGQALLFPSCPCILGCVWLQSMLPVRIRSATPPSTRRSKASHHPARPGHWSSRARPLRVTQQQRCEKTGSHTPHTCQQDACSVTRVIVSLLDCHHVSRRVGLLIDTLHTLPLDAACLHRYTHLGHVHASCWPKEKRHSLTSGAHTIWVRGRGVHAAERQLRVANHREDGN